MIKAVAALLTTLYAARAFGCHVQQRVIDTSRGGTTVVVDQMTATGGVARVTINDQGRWRFEVPLMCTAQQFTEFQDNEVITIKPNMATFVVGIVLAATGGVVTTRSLLADGNTQQPLNVVGPVAFATGLAFMVGPWFGNGNIDVAGRAEKKPVAKVQVACGTRPISGQSATIEFRAVRLFGLVDSNGEFSISPFQTADVFDLATMQGWDVRASLRIGSDELSFANVIDVSLLAPHREAFLASADFDARIETIKLVPGFAPPIMQVSLAKIGDIAALRVRLSVTNEGPGDSWALRAKIDSPMPDINGRILYIGHVGKGQTATRELLIPLAPDAAAHLQGSQVSLSAQLFDAYGTAPAMPVRFSGTVLHDMPR